MSEQPQKEESIWKKGKTGGTVHNARPVTPVDPFRSTHADEETLPTLEAVAAGVVRHPELLREVLRHFAWTDPDAFTEAYEALTQRRDTILRAISEGTFGRDYVAKGL